MTWIIACKEYQKQTGSEKYKVPRKGTAEYDAVKKIFDSLPKPEKKPKVVKPKAKDETESDESPIKLEVLKVKLPKSRKKKYDDPVSDEIRAKIRAELLAEFQKASQEAQASA